LAKESLPLFEGMLLLEVRGLPLWESNNHITEPFNSAAVKMLVYVETAVCETVVGEHIHIGKLSYL
jgi:hypothetical protein